MAGRKRTYAAGGGQRTSSENRGERETPRHDDDERERQFRDASMVVRAGYIRAGGGYLVRRKKLGGDG